MQFYWLLLLLGVCLALKPIRPITLGLYANFHAMRACGHLQVWALEYSTEWPAELMVVVSDIQPHQQAEIRSPFDKFSNFLRVTYVFFDEPRWSGPNRNVVFDRATQELIAMFDVDDLPHPQRLEAIFDIFQRYPDVDVLVHDYTAVDTHTVEPVTLPWLNLSAIPVVRDYGLFQGNTKRGPFQPCSGCKVHNGWVSLRKVVDVRQGFEYRAEDTQWVRNVAMRGWHLAYAKESLGVFNLLERENRCQDITDMVKL